MSLNVTWNTLFEGVVLGGLGAVPVFGGFASAIAGAIWPQDDSTNLEQLQAVSKQLMPSFLDAAMMVEMKNEMDGLKYELRDAGGHSKNQTKTTMADMIDTTDKLFPTYAINVASTEGNLPYLVVFGTIRLCLLREKVLFYKSIYGDRDSKPAKTLQDLRDEIKTLVDKVSAARESIYGARRAAVSIDGPHDSTVVTNDGGGTQLMSTWTVQDTWPTVNFKKMYYKFANPDDPSQVSSDDSQQAKTDYTNLLHAVDTDWITAFDTMLKPYGSWHEFDPHWKEQASMPRVLHNQVPSGD